MTHACTRLLGYFKASGLQGSVELKVPAVDYVTPPPQGSSPPCTVIALVLDATAESSALEALKGAMLQAGLSMPFYPD